MRAASSNDMQAGSGARDASAPNATRTRVWPALCALLALATLLRLCLILAPRGDLYGPDLPQMPGTFIGEEIARGNLAQELLAGPLLHVLDYQYTHFFGGSVVTGVLATVPFAVLGENLVALKLVPLVFQLVALCFLFRILDRWVSRRAAWCGGLMLALSAPGYTQISTIAWGSHMESNALALAAVWAFLALHAPRPDSPLGARLWPRFAFGVLAGFAIWFGYQCLVFLAVLALFELALDPRFVLRRTALVQLAGVLVGLAPWWIYNLRNDFAGLSMYGGSLAEHLSAGGSERSSAVARLFTLWTSELPGALFLPKLFGVSGAVLNGLCFAVLAGFALAAAWHVRRSLKQRPPAPAAIALAYLIVFSLGFCMSDFALGSTPDIRSWRYAMPAMPFLWIAAASGMDAVFRPGSRAPILLTAALAALFTIGSLRACDIHRFGEDLHTPGASRDSLGRWLAVRYADRPDVLERIIARASELRTLEEQGEMYGGMARVLANFTQARPGLTPEQLERLAQYRAAREFLAEHVPDGFRPLFVAPPPGGTVTPPTADPGG